MEISRQTAEFVALHRDEDVRALALRAKRVDGLDLPFALDQIAGRQTARRKLPEWAGCEGIIYPPHLSMEQCSSQFTAQYKAALARRLAGDMDAPSRADAGDHGSDAAVRGAMVDSRSVDNRSVDNRPVDGLIVDLTGGFGVDCSYLARGFTRAMYVERQPHLCELAEHNMAALGLGHVDIVNDDAETVLATLAGAGDAEAAKATLIFVDPARRDEHGGRTVAIEDCTPDVLALKNRLLAAAPHVMVKLSPMLDWRKAVADFAGAVREVHIVSTGNECKELLLVLGRDVVEQPCGTAQPRGAGKTGEDAPSRGDTVRGDIARGDNTVRGDTVSNNRVDSLTHPVQVCCVNDDERLDFLYRDGMMTPASDDHTGNAAADTGATAAGTGARRNPAGTRALGHAPLPEPMALLYEPNASIMKAGCFGLVERRYGVTQVGPGSHLFVAAQPVDGFPGRAFAVERVTGMGKKELKTALAGVSQANIATRNFPLTVAQLRTKLRLRDGGDTYLFATTLAGAKHVLIRSARL